jgi:hypothetical protein
MTTKTGIEKGLFKRIKNLSVIKNLAHTIIIDDPNREILLKKSEKIKGIQTHSKIDFNPKLKKRKLIYKNSCEGKLIITDEVSYKTITSDKEVCECISDRINREFILEIDNFMDQEIKWKFFERNFIYNLFIKRTKSDLIKKIIEIGSNFDWVIVSPKMLKIIETSNYFYKLDPAFTSTITNRGYLKLDNLRLEVFLDKDLEKQKIWFGNWKSVSLILKDKLEIKKVGNQSFSIGIDYQFVKTGDILLLTV